MTRSGLSVEINRRTDMAEIVRWDEPPPMEPGSPAPAISLRNDRLLVAYVCQNPDFPGWDPAYSIEHPGFDVYSAILQFRGVAKHSLGPPNDHGLHKHPLYNFGLQSYDFSEVLDSEGEDGGRRRWIVTFHDEMLDVTAKDCRVLKRRVEGEDTQSILDSIT